MPLTNAERQQRFRERQAEAALQAVSVEAAARAQRDQAIVAEVARLTSEVARLSAAAEERGDNDDAAFIALLKDSYRAGAMRLLGHNGAFTKDKNPSNVTSVASCVVADELTRNPCTAIDLIEAAEAAGERWAGSRWSTVVDELRVERAAANPPTPIPEPVVAPNIKRRKAAVT